MPSRTISLSEDAYQALLGVKRPSESFSETVRRLTRRRSLADLADVMEPSAGERVAAAIDANRRARLTRRRKELGL